MFIFCSPIFFIINLRLKTLKRFECLFWLLYYKKRNKRGRLHGSRLSSLEFFLVHYVKGTRKVLKCKKIVTFYKIVSTSEFISILIVKNCEFNYCICLLILVISKTKETLRDLKHVDFFQSDIKRRQLAYFVRT